MGHDYKAYGIWKSVLSVKDDFDPVVHFRAYNGRRVRFWFDECVVKRCKTINFLAFFFRLDQNNMLLRWIIFPVLGEVLFGIFLFPKESFGL